MKPIAFLLLSAMVGFGASAADFVVPEIGVPSIVVADPELPSSWQYVPPTPPEPQGETPLLECRISFHPPLVIPPTLFSFSFRGQSPYYDWLRDEPAFQGPIEIRIHESHSPPWLAE
jgi:hypothetical protein